MLNVIYALGGAWVLGWCGLYVASGIARWHQERPARRAAHRRRVLETQANHGNRAAAEQLGRWVRPLDD